MEKVVRNFFLFLSKNRTLTKIAKEYGLKFGASRFVAGETIEQAVTVIQDLNKKGLCATVDYLGEFVDNEESAAEMTDHAIRTIEAINKEQLDAQLSVKLTSLGMDISDQTVMANMRRILDAAKERVVFVTIDMEDSWRCEKTLSIYKQLKTEYPQLGTVIQAYLYRSEKDIDDLASFSPHLRLVKGAYKEPASVAFPQKTDVDENYKKLVKKLLLNGYYTAVATHDDAIIDYTKKLVQEYEISNEQFEFQMLYGIRPEKQLELAREGYKMRVYVPYGADWYGYFMRRLAERPANVGFV
jgi:proline dehydrogenase